MALLTHQQLRARVATLSKFDSIVRNAVVEAFDATDVFLSYAHIDRDEIEALARLLADAKVAVFTDWTDSNLDPKSVSKATAESLKQHMKRARSLLFAASPGSADSKWMPWELGYFDGLKGRVAVVPILEQTSAKFEGREYLSLYPYVDYADGQFFVNTADERQPLVQWINGSSDDRFIVVG